MRATRATPAIAACEAVNHRSAAVALALFVAVLGAAVPCAEAATARIQYVSAGNIYLDSGSAAGLAEGMVLKPAVKFQRVAQTSQPRHSH